MAPFFTTSDNVSFDFGTNIISVPDSVNSIDSQWLIDRCRLAEESIVGMSRPTIVSGSGKITIDIDINGNPIKTGVVAVLNGWKISTQKTSGSFAIKDVYRSDGGIPYTEPSPVPVRYQQTIGGVMLQDTSGGGGITPAQIWSYSERTLTSNPGITLTQIESSMVLAKASHINNLQSFITPYLNKVHTVWTAGGHDIENPITAKAPTSTTPGFVKSLDLAINQIHQQNPNGTFTLSQQGPGR